MAASAAAASNSRNLPAKTPVEFFMCPPLLLFEYY
jgi:hypothetical protein